MIVGGSRELTRLPENWLTCLYQEGTWLREPGYDRNTTAENDEYSCKPPQPARNSLVGCCYRHRPIHWVSEKPGAASATPGLRVIPPESLSGRYCVGSSPSFAVPGGIHWPGCYMPSTDHPLRNVKAWSGRLGRRHDTTVQRCAALQFPWRGRCVIFPASSVKMSVMLIRVPGCAKVFSFSIPLRLPVMQYLEPRSTV